MVYCYFFCLVNGLVLFICFLNMDFLMIELESEIISSDILNECIEKAFLDLSLFENGPKVDQSLLDSKSPNSQSNTITNGRAVNEQDNGIGERKNPIGTMLNVYNHRARPKTAVKKSHRAAGISIASYI